MVKKRETKPNVKNKITVSLDEFKSRVRTADMNTYFIFGSIILVLAIGIYAIFSNSARNSMLANPACGKIVIAADGPSLKANVAPTLKRARYFLVINPLSNKLLESVENPYINSNTNGPGLAYFVASKGEEAVIAGDVDLQCYAIFKQFGIRAFGGYNGSVKDAVGLYRQARISPGPFQMNQVAFGLGDKLFICPSCNWQLKTSHVGGGFPSCPNCGVSMAAHMSHQQWGQDLVDQRWVKDWMDFSPFGTVANTVPTNTNSHTLPAQPNFWQGAESMGYFICPSCNWRMFDQKDIGQFPRCPNCKAIMARGGSYYSGGAQRVNNAAPIAQGWNGFSQTQMAMKCFVCPNCRWQVFSHNKTGGHPICPRCSAVMAAHVMQNGVNNPVQAQSIMAPPIYPNANMPHSYRGVCSNCHQIIKPNQANAPSQNRGATQASWGLPDVGGGGICVLK
jgi:predicted Fe-Mo cluster-binding NifX family protein/predicted RNA-binding Zn-ribbon protein involved in translation (DUF1610 family)